MVKRIVIPTVPSDDSEAAAAIEEIMNIALYWFPQSVEGQAGPHRGMHILHLIFVGVEHDITLYEMTPAHIEQFLMNSLLPSVGAETMEDAQLIADEFPAFWRFFQRRYAASNAAAILAYLDEIGPQLPEMIFNSPGAVEDRTLIAAGEAAGFDMNDDVQADRFMDHYFGASNPESPRLNRAKRRKKARKSKAARQAKKRRSVG
jgi:hypothetical protein